MEFWAIMWITMMGGMLDGETTSVAYPSLDACEAALTPVSNTLPYDHSIVCEETALASGSIQPQQRPEGLTK